MPIVKVTGPGHASHSFVLLHGTPGDHTDLEPVMALGPRDATVAWVDLPDHGEAADELALNLDVLENDIVAAIESSAGAVTVVGYSLGAYLAARVLPRVGAKVARAVLISGLAHIDSEMARAISGAPAQGYSIVYISGGNP